MALVINTSKQKETYEYVPKSERGTEKPFTIEFKRLTLRQLAKIDDNMVTLKNQQDMTFSAKTTELDLLKTAITDWFNVDDENGKPIKIKKAADGSIKDESLELFQVYHSEIASVISNVSRYPQDANIYLDIDPEDAAE